MVTKEDETWISEQTLKMVQEVMRFLDTQAALKGKEVGKQLSTSFLASFIGAKVFLCLKDAAGKVKPNDKGVDKVNNDFLDLKVEIQNSVAAAFQGAMQEFSGKQLEYYCQIKLVPMPKNNMIC